jgi:hypothetical protein
LLLKCAFIDLNAQKEYTCINEKGNNLFAFVAEQVQSFDNGMAAFQTLVNNQWRWGFINETGKVVIEPIYEKVKSFAFNVCWIKPPDSDFILINKNGKQISEKSYKKVGFFIEDVCAVYEGINMGFINTEGKEILPCKYIGSPAYSDGLVCLSLADATTENYGFFDKKGNMAIPFKFKQGGFTNFVNGECRVQINGKTNLINKKGDVIFSPKLSNNMENFCNGLAMTYTKPGRKGIGYFNRNNTWVIKPIYESGTSFSNGFAVIKLNGKSGVIDSTGKTIIPVEFDNIYANAITDGFFVAEKNNEKIYLNENGTKFTSEKHEYILSKKEHSLLPFKSANGKMGYLTEKGALFIEAKYQKAESFSNGKAWVIN